MKIPIKARPGVTLVELLVVILIVTILSVSLLPLMKPYIEEAKYAAEALPVVANIQTKVNLYQYEHDKLPGSGLTQASDASGAPGAPMDSSGYAQTWTAKDLSGGGVEYVKAIDTIGATCTAAGTEFTGSGHFASQIDVDWQDLVGRRMNPTHFKYVVVKGDDPSVYCYAIGVFGDGDGLGMGTGYAVLTAVNVENKNKVVATWSRYKPVSNEQIYFDPSESGASEVGYNTRRCWLPDPSLLVAASDEGGSTLKAYLAQTGWEFSGSDKWGRVEGSGDSNPGGGEVDTPVAGSGD